MEGIINIAGVMPRIGTTTFALQLIKFLKVNGYDAAYIERNPSRYMENAVKMYADSAVDPATGKRTCEEIDLFPEQAMETLTAGGARYDYLVCDFGDVNRRDFPKETFLRKGVPVFVAGAKANELTYTEQALQDQNNRKAAYLFNFIRDADKQEVQELMKELGPVTAFLSYTPDPFVYAGNADQEILVIMNYVTKTLQEVVHHGKV